MKIPYFLTFLLLLLGPSFSGAYRDQIESNANQITAHRIETAKFLRRLSDSYYCLSREGLQGFNCQATSTFSGQLPKGLAADWKGFDWQKSRCTFDFSYSGGEVLPILTFLSNGGDPDATRAKMEKMTEFSNSLLMAWSSFELLPLFTGGPGARYTVLNGEEGAFSVQVLRWGSLTTVHFNNQNLAESIVVHDRYGAHVVKLTFLQTPQGKVLQHAEMDYRGRGTPFNLDLVVQYEQVQFYQLPSALHFFVRTPGKLFHADYQMAGYQVQSVEAGKPLLAQGDSQVVPASSENPSAKHLLWRVRSPNATVYLLGSIHVRPNVPLQVPEVVEKSFQSADAVGFESDLSKQVEFEKEREGYFELHCTYPEGDSLQKHLTAEEWQKVRAFLNLLDIPVEQAVQYKPYILSQLAFRRPTAKNAFITKAMGIDNIFLRKAQAAKKPVFGMEFWYAGFQVLDTLSDHDQVHFFTGDTQHHQNGFLKFEEMLVDWRNGNTGDLEALQFQDVSPEEKDINDKLVGVRNHNWLTQFDRIFQTHATYFIVVGSAHLLGADGLPSLLKQKGYTVEQL